MNIKKSLTLIFVSIAWLWTAYECATVGIDVFDMILLKKPTNGCFVWALALGLIPLTMAWMPRNLLTRAVMGIFMLIPAEAFPLIRPHLPDGGFAWIQVLVGFIYLLAIIGMYGMFYPWRIEQVLAKFGLLKNPELPEPRGENNE